MGMLLLLLTLVSFQANYLKWYKMRFKGFKDSKNFLFEIIMIASKYARVVLQDYYDLNKIAIFLQILRGRKDNAVLEQIATARIERK